MLASKLTLVYGRYHMMMDLRSLAISKEQYSYDHAEVMADFMNCLLPFQHTNPSDLMQSRESYADQSIDMYKEYRHYLEMFEGECFLPRIIVSNITHLRFIAITPEQLFWCADIHSARVHIREFIVQPIKVAASNILVQQSPVISNNLKVCHYHFFVRLSILIV